MSTVSLGGQKNVVTRPQQTATLTEVTVVRYVDLPEQKIVRAFVKELDFPVVLWQGNTYDAIGNWTDAQAQARLAEVINGMA